MTSVSTDSLSFNHSKLAIPEAMNRRRVPRTFDGIGVPDREERGGG